MAIVESNSELGQQIVADAKAVRPPFVVGAGRASTRSRSRAARAATSGTTTASATSTSPRSSSTSSLGHQHPKLVAAIKEQADKLCTIGPPMATRAALDARAPARRGDARRPLDVVLHERRRRGERERDQARALVHGPRTRSSRATARTTARRRARSRSPATRAAGRPSRASRASCACSTRTRIAAPPAIPIRARSARGAPHLEEILQYEGAAHRRRRDPGDGHRDERHHRPARRLPAVDPRGVRPARHPADLRRGDGRLRAHGQVVRVRELGRRPGHPHRREGDQLRLRAARRDGHLARSSRDWVRDKPFAGGLTYSGHPLACASGVASIEAFREEGIVENAAAHGRYLADALRALQERHPSIGDVRGLGLFWGLELVRNRETREPLVPFNAAGEAAAPVDATDEGGARARPLPLRALERDHASRRR